MQGKIRVGIGYDVHPLTPGRRLVLGGVEIPFNKGLSGWSDADVLTHAIMDALLGSCALGDIGHYFPPDDPTLAGADSLNLLARVVTIVRKHGMRPVQVDSVIICEEPKLEPYLGAMRENVARVLKIKVTDIGIKATTNEGLGAVGRGEGIAAQAVVVVEKVNNE